MKELHRSIETTPAWGPTLLTLPDEPSADNDGSISADVEALHNEAPPTCDCC